MTVKFLDFGFEPNAKNSLSTRTKYFHRLSYDISFEMVVLSKGYDRNIFIDSRDYHLFYGRLDRNNFPINVSETNLKNIADSRDLYVLSFVSDAYRNLLSDLKIFFNSGFITDNKFVNLKAKKGWTNIQTKYHEHMNRLFEQFLKFIKINNKNKTIIDFKSFLTLFVEFIDKNADKTPFLKSSFVTGIDCGLSDTGLSIELENYSKDSDYKKIKDYLENDNFYYFHTLSKKHGFAIDKECPWRLIFNVNFPEAQRYMSVYDNTNSNNVFDKFFYKTYYYDMENLKRYSAMMYNTIVKDEEILIIPYIEKKEQSYITSKNSIERRQINIENMSEIIPDNFWFKLFCYIFLLENEVKLNQSEYDILINELINIANVSIDAAIIKLTDISDTYEKTNKKNYNFSF